MREETIINRVASSSLITFDLEQLYVPGNRHVVDIKDQLYEGLILKEKEFRSFVKTENWSKFKDSFVAITCTADAIVPTWAFMLLAIVLQPFAKKIVFGSADDLEKILYKEALDAVDWNKFRDAKVVVKGCSRINVPVSAYVETVSRLQPIASNVMFGEPCSTVPLYKKSKT